MTATTRTSVMSIVTWMSLKASRMLRERSPRTVRWTDGGSCSRNDGQQRANGVRDVDGVAARLPHHRHADRALRRAFFVYSHDAFLLSSTSSMTVATCDRRSGAPLRYVTISGLKASAFISWPPAWML